MQIIYVDFTTQKITNVEEQVEHLDPVMQRIKNKLDPKWWETYKKTIDHYHEECFMYQMEEKNGMMYDPEEVTQWEKHRSNT